MRWYPDLSKERVFSLFSPYKRLFSHLPPSDLDRRSLQLLPELPTRNTKKDFGVICVNNVSKHFGKHVILHDVSLEIKPGSIFGLIGVSGSGKTTLLKLLIGFYKPTKGSISFKDKVINKQMNTIKRSFGFATQTDCFYGKLNVEENIIYFGKLNGLTQDFIDAHMDNVLTLVGLTDARQTLAENLSKGMQRRLDLACALIQDPSVLILDEPTEDLDPFLRREMLKLIKHISQNGTTIIITSHLLWEVEMLCDQVAILAEGTVAQVGSPTALKKAYTQDQEVYLESLPGKYEPLATLLRKQLHKVKYLDHHVIFYTGEIDSFLPKLLTLLKKRKEKVIKLTVKQPSLSEVFQSLTRKKIHGKKH